MLSQRNFYVERFHPAREYDIPKIHTYHGQSEDKEAGVLVCKRRQLIGMRRMMTTPIFVMRCGGSLAEMMGTSTLQCAE
jgi:hypothetical protein